MATGRRIYLMFLLTITVLLPPLSAAPLDPSVPTDAGDVDTRAAANDEDDLKNGHEKNIIAEQDQREAKLSFDLSGMSIDVSGSLNIQQGFVGNKFEINVNEHSHEHRKDGGDHQKVDMVPVDCQWSEYTDWSACSASCGDGYRQRERKVVTSAKDGGNPCVGENVEKERCNAGPCTGLKKEEKFPCSFNDDQLIAIVESDGQLSPHDTSALFKWENNIIPYFFTSTSDKDKKLFRSVMAIIESETCFEFEEKTEAEYKDKHSLEIETGGWSCSYGCGGYIAKVPYYNRLKLTSDTQVHDTDSCESQCGGFILHELMHALGVGHTMRRSDRDDFITINHQNVNSLHLDIQFKKCSQCMLYPEVPYDCNSIMHYGTHFNGLEIYKPNDPSTCKLEQNSRLNNGAIGSILDWKLLNIIGKCSEEENGPSISTDCFSSPVFPNKYPDNSDTKQTFTVEGQAIEITFNHFDVEYQNTCSYDYLKFFDANSNPVGKKMCGQSLPQKFIIPTSAASFLFHSDGSVNKKGYRFCYKPVKLICTAGELNSASCFCKSATDDVSGEVCSANQGCTEEGTCYEVCIPGPYFLQADCFCEEKTKGKGEICTEGLKCVDGGCLNEEAKHSCSFDDDLLVPKVEVDGQMSPHDTSELFKWEDNVIPYYYKDDSSRDADKDLIRSVMDRIEEKTCFTFEEKNKEDYEDKHSLEIVIKDASCTAGCAGAVAKVPYKERLVLKLTAHITDDFGDDCGYKGLLIHELMHALGVGHTQRRSDRDNFIQVKFENLQGKNEQLIKQYRKCETCTLYDEIPYDCGSIMHYGTHIHGKEVIVPKENCVLRRAPLLFTVPDASEKDYELLNIIGKCAGDKSCISDNGDACMFPFTYEGNEYNGCTDVDHSQNWCSTKEDDGTETWWGNCPLGCKTHSENLQGDQAILISGGFVDVSKSADGSKSSYEVLDLEDGSTCSRTMGQLPQKRYFHSMNNLDGSILLCGGSTTGTENSCITYMSLDGSWLSHSVTKVKRKFHSSAVVDGKLWLLGGNNGESVESLEGGIWSEGPAPPFDIGSGSCAVTVQGKIIVIVGSEFSKRVLQFDLDTNKWTELPSLNTGRWYHECAVIGEQIIVVAGGRDQGGETLKSSEMYQIGQEKWQTIGDLNTERSGLQMITVNTKVGQKVVAMGGRDKDRVLVDSVEELVKGEDGEFYWTLSNFKMEQGRYGFGVTAVEKSSFCK